VGSQDDIASISTQQAGHSGSPISGARDYCLLSNVYQASYSKILSSGYSIWGVTLTTHHHKSIEVMNEWSYTSTPPMCLNGMDRDNFTFPPLL